MSHQTEGLPLAQSHSTPPTRSSSFARTFTDIVGHCCRLRQVDVKAEHFERQVARVEQERDSWEKKAEEANEKYNQSKKELDEVVLQMESI